MSERPGSTSLNRWHAPDYTADKLAKDLGRSYERLSREAARIDRDGYQRFVQKKGRKTRVFAAPSPWLKTIQRGLADRLFPNLPLSSHVYSRRGRDVVQNARQHVGRPYRLTVDIADCFPSTTLAMVRSALEDAELPRNVAGLITRIVTYNGRLPQGSPCSPAVLDCVLYRLDESLARLAAEYGGVYSRFVDDLTFSADVPLAALRRRASKIVRSYGYTLRQEKTRSTGPGDFHTVTGIAVRSTLHAPPAYLDQVRHEISAFGRGRRSVNERSLSGKIQWVGRIDRSDAATLQRHMSTATAKRRRRGAGQEVQESSLTTCPQNRVKSRF